MAHAYPSIPRITWKGLRIFVSSVCWRQQHIVGFRVHVRTVSTSSSFLFTVSIVLSGLFASTTTMTPRLFFFFHFNSTSKLNFPLLTYGKWEANFSIATQRKTVSLWRKVTIKFFILWVRMWLFPNSLVDIVQFTPWKFYSISQDLNGKMRVVASIWYIML